MPKLIPALKISPITLQEQNNKEIIRVVVMIVRFFIIVYMWVIFSFNLRDELNIKSNIVRCYF